MRIDPDKCAAARARLLAMTCGDLAPAAPVSRRTASRRAQIPQHSSTVLAALPDDVFLRAADADALTNLMSLTAALHIAHDLAAVIDRQGRDQLDAALGEGIRSLALTGRRLAGPRLYQSVPGLIATHSKEMTLARAYWASVFPSGIRLADGAPTGPLPLLPANRRDQRDAQLIYAAAALKPAVAEDKVLAA